MVLSEVNLKALQELDRTHQYTPAATSAAFVLARFLTGSGVFDELVALERMGILQVNEFGIPSLSKHWYTQMDLLLLDDMDRVWGTRSDPRGLAMMNKEVVLTLKKRWTKTYYGWCLADDESDVVYDFGEYDEWRDAFESKEQRQAEATQGVGMFGI